MTLSYEELSGRLVKKSWAEIPTPDCAVCRARSEVQILYVLDQVPYLGETEKNQEMLLCLQLRESLHSGSSLPDRG